MSPCIEGGGVGPVTSLCFSIVANFTKIRYLSNEKNARVQACFGVTIIAGMLMLARFSRGMIFILAPQRIFTLNYKRNYTGLRLQFLMPTDKIAFASNVRRHGLL